MATQAPRLGDRGGFTSLRRTRRVLVTLGGLVAWLGLASAAPGLLAGEAPMREYQVKALFLMNFPKYVEWPAVSFGSTNTPIVIGIVGENRFGNDLDKAVEGKQVNGRRITVRQLERDTDFAGCHVLFIGASERKRLSEILARVAALPVLTVGEDEQFMQQGGIINFVKKEGKVRLEINADAARRSNLEVSSQLLGVADVVKGKP